jgi:opacity protein-like surface antigen
MQRRCVLVVLLMAVAAAAQVVIQGGNGTAGTITAVGKDSITIRSLGDDGASSTVKITDKTEFRKAGQPAKFADFAVGEMVAIRGESDGKGTWTAERVIGGMGFGGGGDRDQAGGAVQFRTRDGRMPGVGGTITKIEGDTLTLKAMNGSDIKVRTAATTQFRGKDQNAGAKLADFKAGDMVAVRGKQAADGAWDADAVMSISPQMRAMAENLGKEFIAGRVKAINGTKLVIERVDQQEQTIEVDENTSFRKSGESITLPDVKVGDMVFGPGKLKDGTFVPATLNVGMPGNIRLQAAPM